MPAPVAGPADVVELELEPPEATRRPATLVLLLVRIVGDARREGDPRPVRRPGRLAHVVVHLRQPPGLAAAERDHVQLPRLVVAALGDERERRAVRPPPRLRVVRA